MSENEDDPVDAMCRAMSAEKFVDWLIEYKGMDEGSRDNVVMNLREQFKWHRLQGRCDRRPFLLVLAELFGMRQGVKALQTPTKK
jgi:hypothetical protein